MNALSIKQKAAKRSAAEINLKSLRRLDALVEKVVHTTKHVVIYQMSPQNTWVSWNCVCEFVGERFIFSFCRKRATSRDLFSLFADHRALCTGLWF